MAARALSVSAPEGFERRRICRHGEYLLPPAFAKRDQQRLVDVELASEPSTARAVDGDGVLVVRKCPPQLAQIRPVGEPPRLAEEPEDFLAAAILARHGNGPRHAPDRVLGDHLHACAGIAAAE